MKIFLSFLLALLVTSIQCVGSIASQAACTSDLSCSVATDVCCHANITDTNVSPAVVTNATICYTYSETPTLLSSGTSAGYTVYCKGKNGMFKDACTSSADCNTVDS